MKEWNLDHIEEYLDIVEKYGPDDFRAKEYRILYQNDNSLTEFLKEVDELNERRVKRQNEIKWINRVCVILWILFVILFVYNVIYNWR